MAIPGKFDLIFELTTINSNSIQEIFIIMEPGIESEINIEVKSGKDYKKTMEAAVRLLYRRKHTSHELYKKLILKGFEKDFVKAAISECKQLNYINDKETAVQYYHELKARGYGAIKVRFEMRRKGIEPEYIEDIFTKFYNDNEEIETARKVLQKKMHALKREKNKRKFKEKIYRFLSYRGFSGSIISKLIHDLDNSLN